jgi:hypothetical protein
MDKEGSFEKYPNIPYAWDFPQEKEDKNYSLLRDKILKQCLQDVLDRVAHNPEPSEEELSAGTYKEAIEPQCRDAIFKIRQKGYDTYSSGFGAGNSQVLDGLEFNFDIDTIKKLQDNGYVVYKIAPDVLSVLFLPKSTDMREITDKWNALADLLPDLSQPAPPQTEDRAEFDELLKSCFPQIRRRSR